MPKTDREFFMLLLLQCLAFCFLHNNIPSARQITELFVFCEWPPFFLITPLTCTASMLYSQESAVFDPLFSPRTDSSIPTTHCPAWVLLLWPPPSKCNPIRFWCKTGGLSSQTGPKHGVRPSHRPFMHLQKKGAEIWQHGSALLLLRRDQEAETLLLRHESAVLLHWLGFHDIFGEGRTSAACRLHYSWCRIWILYSWCRILIHCSWCRIWIHHLWQQTAAKVKTNV